MPSNETETTYWMRLDMPGLATIGLRVEDGIVVGVPLGQDRWLLNCPIDALQEFCERRGWTLEMVNVQKDT